MPLFLPLEISKKWLEENLDLKEYKEILDFEMPSDFMKYVLVYTIRPTKERLDLKPKNDVYNWEKIRRNRVPRKMMLWH